MYILKKRLPFIPKTPFYQSDKKSADHSSIFTSVICYGTFHRYRAKVFRWYFSAWFANLWFKGEIEKIHIQL